MDDDRPRDGDGRPSDSTHHIGHADVVEDGSNDDADSDRHRCQSPNCVSLVSHFFTPFQKASSKQRTTLRPFGNFERKVNIYISIRTKSQIFRKITLCFL